MTWTMMQHAQSTNFQMTQLMIALPTRRISTNVRIVRGIHENQQRKAKCCIWVGTNPGTSTGQGLTGWEAALLEKGPGVLVDKWITL